MVAIDAACAERAIDVRIAGRKPAGGARTVQVSEGDRVVLRVTSDEAMTIHVHGYDARGRVAAGGEATLVVQAKATGRFPVTAHPDGPGHREPTLLYLEVHPR
jgi:FtsP/CotA-like multicopper oxidase with cupredoxin domain